MAERYALSTTTQDDNATVEMVEQRDGIWARYEDLEEVERDRDKALDAKGSAEDRCEELEGEVEDLKRQLQEVQNTISSAE